MPLLVSGLALAGLVACGGVASSDLFDPGAVREDASLPTPADGPAVAERDAAAPRDATAPVDASAPDGRVLPDASIEPDGAAPPKDAAADAPGPTAYRSCGRAPNGPLRMCGPTEECCFDSKAEEKLACEDRGTCAGIVVPCASGLDCPMGQMCCGTFDRSTGYQSVECRGACPADNATTTYPRLCTGNPGECVTGQTCRPSGTLEGFSVCR